MRKREMNSPYALETLLILVSAVVLIWLLSLLPVQAAADQSGKCSIAVELGELSDIVITDVDTDGYSGNIQYETRNKGQSILTLVQGSGGKMLPMNIRVNNRSVRLSDLRGASVRTMKATRKDCKFSHPVIGSRSLSQQWTIRAELSR